MNLLIRSRVKDLLILFMDHLTNDFRINRNNGSYSKWWRPRDCRKRHRTSRISAVHGKRMQAASARVGYRHLHSTLLGWCRTANKDELQRSVFCSLVPGLAWHLMDDDIVSRSFGNLFSFSTTQKIQKSRGCHLLEVKSHKWEHAGCEILLMCVRLLLKCNFQCIWYRMLWVTRCGLFVAHLRRCIIRWVMTLNLIKNKCSQMDSEF